MAAAVKSPGVPSPSNSLMSAFSPYSDSPSSPAYPHNNKRSSTDSQGHLQPSRQKSPQPFSPSSDIADPSPIASSNGTDSTDIDESGVEDEKPRPLSGSSRTSIKAGTPPQVLADKAKASAATKDEDGNDFKPSSEDDQPQSVIHAPGGFQSFQASPTPPNIGRSTPTPSQRSDLTIISPNEEQLKGASPKSPPPISTSGFLPMRDTFNTPRAQTRQEAEALEQERAAKVRSQSLEDIPESFDTDVEDDGDQGSDVTAERVQTASKSNEEVTALRLALGECWTLCNTLAGLSHVHRERSFRSRSQDGRGQAWKACWKLCQTLYDTWDEGRTSQVAPTLNLCRDFCQSLFEVRQREDDLADSVLRVSFELNNHLYNTHDRALPEAFRERTLDFYITLCHRLMKQRGGLLEDSDALLRACWSLAEMLFSLRQNQREGKPADEELLGSAVQSCWELCDLFREGWTQVRPDRGTPRPSQTTFTQAFTHASLSEKASAAASTISLGDGASSIDDYDDLDLGRLNPETPTTIFEDSQQLSPDEGSLPNIVVLGPEAGEYRGGSNNNSYVREWSSASSTLSGFSGGARSVGESASSSGTIVHPPPGTPAGAADADPRLQCLRLLIVRAALNLGYAPGDAANLQAFAKSLPSGSFGAAPWQVHLSDQYKKLVAADPSFKTAGPPRRARAPDVARSVRWMTNTGEYIWLNDLFRWVFGFRVEEAGLRPGVDIQSF